MSVAFPFAYDATSSNPSEYTPEQLSELINSVVTDGIIPNENGEIGTSLQTTAKTGKTVTVAKGTIIICGKLCMIDETDILLGSSGNGTYDVVASLNYTDSIVEIQAIKRTTGNIENVLTRTANVLYQVGLASVEVTGDTILDNNITDQRSNSTLCSDNKPVNQLSKMYHNANYDNHLLEQIYSENGSHGIRYYNSLLQYYNGSEWTTIETGGGGVTEEEVFACVSDGTTEIPNWASSANWFLSKVSIPSSVTTIGDYFCYKTPTLGEVLGGENVETFSSSAFQGCTNLTDISLPSATTFGRSAFQGCTNLTDISLPSATKFYDSAFQGCTNLTDISLPSATTFGSSAFQGCTNLTDISLPSATKFYDSAFQSCINLTDISLPSATTFGSSAFQGCINLTDISLPSATTFGSYAFQGCINLTDISLPSATTFGSYAFQGCTNLTDISLPSATTFGHSAFQSCTNLTDISLPSATTFSSSAFQSCIKLTNINLGSRNNVLEFTSPFYLKSSLLTVASLLQVGNALKSTTTTKTIYIDTTAWGRLSATQQAIFTNKGYTIATA